MAALDVTNTLTAVITSTEDTTQNVPINRGLGNPAFDSNFAEFVTYKKLSIGDNVIILPAALCWQLYVRNIDPAAFVIVKWQTGGGAAQSSPQLAPGEVCIPCWSNPASAAPSGGYTSFTLTATAACLVEFFIGG